MRMYSYDKRHTPVPRPYAPGAIPEDERNRTSKSLNERKATPEEMAEIIRKYGPPKCKLNERKGFGGGAA